MIPVPGYGIGTPYGRRGPYWSCDEDAYGNGIHTGVDYPAPTGTRVVAARGGKVVYCNHGSAFGSHQMEILPGDGTRDFYAHMTTRAPADGAQIEPGATVGKVGAEGNVTGPHLHFERHAVATGGWNCSIIRDPAPSINYQPAGGSAGAGAGTGEDEDDMPQYAHGKLAKKIALRDEQWHAIEWKSGEYFDGAGVLIGGSRFSATLAVHIADRGDAVVQTGFVETDDGDPVETYADNAAGAFNNAVDTRNGGVQDGRRLRARVRVIGQDATLDAADIVVLFWPV